MEKLDVVAGFDWLDKEEKVGTLGHDSLRGSDVFSFEFDRVWLKSHSDIILGKDLLPFTGIQYSPSASRIFGCISDALPDRWGRGLVDQRIVPIAASPNPALPESKRCRPLLPRSAQARLRFPPEGPPRPC